MFQARCQRLTLSLLVRAGRLDAQRLLIIDAQLINGSRSETDNHLSDVRRDRSQRVHRTNDLAMSKMPKNNTTKG